MNSNLLESLSGMVEFYANQEEDNIKLIIERLRNNQQHGAVYESLARSCIYNGLNAFLNKDEISQVKQWFYVSSLLRIESARYLGGFSYTLSTPDEFIFPILSDNTEVIEKFSHLDTVHLLWGEFEPNYQEAKFELSKDDPRYRTHALQAVLRHDWEDYQKIKDIANQKINKIREVVQFEFGIYDAIYEKDKDKIIEIVQTLLTPKVHKVYNKDFGEEFNGEIWSHHPVMFTKLAWMNGLEIEIDNPLVPMELMPIKPLEHYDYYYDFLDPTWKPRSFWGKLFNRK